MTGTPDALAQERARRARNGMTVERFRTVSATGDVNVTDRFVFVETVGGSVTLTLPPAAQMIGRVLTFDKRSAGNTLTLDGYGSETIDGSLTLSWATRYEAHTLFCDGVEWWHV